ncbi:MAG: hypothetical protein RL308_2034 [Bacteroidota bacterium]
MKKYKRQLKILFWKLARTNDSVSEIGLGAAIGTFISVFPTFGFGTLLVLVFSRFVKFNLVIALATSVVSNPFTSPFFLFLSYKIGSFVTGVTIYFDLKNWKDNLVNSGLTLFVGSFILSGIMAFLGYLIATIIVKFYRKKR